MTAQSKLVSMKKQLLLGALLGMLWGLYKALSSSIPWEGDGLLYNLGRTGGGAIMGMFVGPIVFWIRDKLQKRN
ncbi:MAG: hypothetical protein GC131_05045 [Alphaproteobacteria bacterium]|nr:hypothetical protein [Alphaproteobacteria bacterium]